jgi:uncharacterized OB-fold protein
MQSIDRAIAILPAYRLEDLRVPGPDEDTFTLAVAALEGLVRPSARPSRLHLIGEFSPVAEWGFRSYFGTEALATERYSSGSGGLFRALVTAAQSEPALGPTIVVAAEVATPSKGVYPPPFGGGALAFHFGGGPGILPLEAKSTPRQPDEVIAQKDPASPTDSLRPWPGGDAIATLRLFDSNLPTPRPPAPPSEVASRALPAWGDAPTLGPGLGIYRLARKLAPGATGVLEDWTVGSIHSLTLRRDGEVAWLGAFGETSGPGVALSEEVWRRSFDRPTHAVSQGAYVPRARYLENLPSRWKFEAARCPACGAYALPPRSACPRCNAAQGMVAETLPHDGGTVIAATTIGPGGQPTEFDSQVELTGGYQVVLVELAPGIRVTLQVSDAPSRGVEIGGQVGTRLRRLYAMEGEWRYGRKAIPFDPRSGPGNPPSLERWAPP